MSYDNSIQGLTKRQHIGYYNSFYPSITVLVYIWLILNQNQFKLQRNNGRLTRPYIKTPAKEVAVIVVFVVTTTSVVHIALSTADLI